MLETSLSFKSAGWLALLLLLPWMWWISWRNLKALGRSRRMVAIGLRSVVFAALVIALAEVQWVTTNTQLTVYFLLDQSRSIPEPQRRAMTEYVNRLAAEHRQQDDAVGVIVFGERAAVEVPAFAADPRLRSTPDAIRGISADQTDVAAALRLALASFPPETARRIVIVTDANQTRGDGLEAARRAVSEGVSIDVVPVVYEYPGEVLVESVSVPPDVRREEPFDLRVVLNNTHQSTPVGGRLLIYSTAGGTKRIVFSDEDLQRVEAPPGKSAWRFPMKIDEPDFYRFEAEFLADRPELDPVTQNNAGRVFVHVVGTARLLLIENDEPEYQGQHTILADRLRSEGMEVEIRPASQAFDSLADLQAFDAVILADVPKRQIDDTRLEMLVRNTHDTGGGLVVLGGPHSFGAGGWNDSPLEEALPVDFHIKNIQTMPTGALALVIDRSGSMAGENMAMARAAANAAVDMLSPRDFVSVTAFDTHPHVVVPLTRVSNPAVIKRQIARIVEGGGTDLMPGMEIGYRDLMRAREASVRHMIVLTDGHTPPAQHVQRARQMLRSHGITTSAIAVGAGADAALCQRIAAAGGGKFYKVNNPRNLPRVFTKEAEIVTRSPVHRNEQGFAPQAVQSTEALAGLPLPLPPITGYVMTTIKDSPLIELSLLAPEPLGEATEANRTILAQWRYGLGRAVALTTDTGARWATNWTGWDGYGKFFSQLVRGAMRPTADSGQFLVDTLVRDGEVTLVVTALGEDNRFLNFQAMAAMVSGPGRQEGQTLSVEQEAPGRYVGRFPAPELGTYLVTLVPGPDTAPIRLGVDIPYSDEFRVQETNVPLARALAELQVDGHSAGRMIDGSAGPVGLTRDETPFRHDLPLAESQQPAWPWFVGLACCVFFLDVANRRVALGVRWIPETLGRVRERLFGSREDKPDVYFERLKAKKAEARSRYAEATEVSGRRFEIRPEAPAAEPTSSPSPLASRSDSPPARAKEMTPDIEDQPESYADRLLKAKRRVWKQDNRPNDTTPPS